MSVRILGGDAGVAIDETKCMTPDRTWCDGWAKEGDWVVRVGEGWSHTECMPEEMMW
jgi:hypothetical protein